MELRSNTPIRQPPADYCPAGSACWHTLDTGHDAGKTLFYSDHCIGDGSAGTVLLVHGNPECSYTWRRVRDALIASGRPLRIVAPDHIGLGLSDQASFEMVDMHHADNLRQLVQALDLRDVTLVVHDWGGPIGIGALLDTPERVRGLVVANSTIFPMPDDGYTYTNYPFPWLPWFLTPRLIPDALWGGVAAAVVTHAQPQSTWQFLRLTTRWLWAWWRRSIAPGSAEYVWSEPMRSTANARSSKRMVRQTPVWGHGYRYHDATLGEQDNHAFYKTMQRQLAACWGPRSQAIQAAGHFGQWDACGKNSVIEQWTGALPGMADDLHRYPDCGHFIEEEQPEAIAQSILRMAIGET